MNKQMFSMRHLVPAANTIHKPTGKAKQVKHKLMVPYKKQKIPKALAEQVWIRYMGRSFEGKCRVHWCQNTITVFEFQCGHNIPESRGGATTLENLIPICSRCNLGMGNKKTIDEWSAEYTQQPQPQPRPQPNIQQTKPSFWRRLGSCFTVKNRPHA